MLPAHTYPADRRRLLLLALPAVLSACASPLPAITWVRLPAQAPGMVAAGHGNPASPANPASPPAAPAAPAEVWQLMQPLRLPGHLDRDALLLPSGSAGLQPLGAVRWAEPLRDAVPRLLRQDLTQARGAPLWAAPLPPGVQARRQLRIDIDALDVAPGGRAVLLQARWTLADALGSTPPQVGEAAFSTAADGSSADALAVAHRQALWQLAQRIAAMR